MIIGVDPGKQTGVWIMPYPSVWPFGDEFPALDAVAYVDQNTLPGRHITIAVERYDIGPMTGKLSRQYEALEVIGALKYLAFQKGNITIIMQQRAAKKRVPNAVLKQLNWWKAGSAGHVHDAQRHALVCAASITPWHDLVKRAFGTIS